jgi:uncharacterized protein (TIGR02246 family)
MYTRSLEVMMRKSTLLSLAVLAAACSETPSAPSGGSALGSPEPADADMAVVAVGNEGEILALVDAGETAWAAKDPAAYAAIFADDVEFISPLGTYLHGRSAVRAQHVLLFGGPFAGSTLDIVPESIRFLTGTVAVVDVRNDLTGYQFLPPGLVAAEPGVLRVLVRWVVVKRAGRWEIAFNHMTQVLPGA